MIYRIISGSVYEVTANSTTEAWELFKKSLDGDATAEELSLVSDTGETSFEVRYEGEHNLES